MNCETGFTIAYPEGCQFPSVATAAALRALVVADIDDGDNYVVDGNVIIGDGLGGVYVFVAASLEVDDGRMILRPDGLTSLQAGRWKLVDTGSSASFIQPDTGAVARPVAIKLRDYTATVTDFGASPNGVTDARAAILAATAAGPLVVPEGLFYVGSSMSIISRAVFLPGGRLVIPEGVTVTFQKGVDAPPEQIFNFTGSGTGSVLGLVEAHAQWFCGDISNRFGGLRSSIACDALLQKAFNATQGGTLRDGPYERIKGTTQISINDCDYLGGGVLYLWNSANTVGFNVGATTRPGRLSGFRFKPLVPGTVPTAGLALLCGRSDLRMSDIETLDAYEAIDIAAGVSINLEDFKANGSRSYGVRVKTNDVFIRGGAISALNDWITTATSLGNAGDTINVTGSTGFIAEKYDSTHYRIFFNDKRPEVGDAITSSSGGSTTISAVTVGHQNGGFRTEGNVEAVAVDDLDVLGGNYSLQIVSYAPGTIGRAGNMNACRFGKGVYFDSPYLGAAVEGAYGSTFDCWFSNSRSKSAPGATFTYTGKLRGSPQVVANSGYGLVFQASCVHTRLSAPEFDGNCRNYAGEADMTELRLVGAVQRFAISDATVGFTGTNGVTPPSSIALDGAADYLKFHAINCPAGSIVWNSTGTHNRRSMVDGLGDI